MRIWRFAIASRFWRFGNASYIPLDTRITSLHKMDGKLYAITETSIWRVRQTFGVMWAWRQIVDRPREAR